MDASPQRECSSLAERYLAAQLAGDRREALRLVVDEALGRGVSVSDIHATVIVPAQRAIGRLWQENRISVAQEHIATAISQLVMAHLYHQLPRGPSKGSLVLLACVEGEQHDMGARLAADALEIAGFDVRFLGASVPTDSLVTQVERDRPDVVALSVTMSFHLPAARAAVLRLKGSVPSCPPVVVGGHAVGWSAEAAASLGADATGASSDELIAAIESVARRS